MRTRIEHELRRHAGRFPLCLVHPAIDSWLPRRQERTGDARRYLRRLYQPTWAKSLLLPWARRRYQSKRLDASCDHVDCTCVWCRCGGEYA